MTDPLIDPETGRRFDYYKLLGLEGWPGEDAAKKAYYKAAMRLHPDRNRDDIDRAETLFKYLQEAWNTLRSPTERAYYDSHRDLILSGGVEEDEFYGIDTFVNLNLFRRRAAFEEVDDGERGFYKVYSGVFNTLADEEQRAARRRLDIKSYTSSEQSRLERWALLETYPPFGSSTSTQGEVHKFYSFWERFQSVKEFAHVDMYTTKGNSRYKRLAEGENEKLRQKARLDFSERVKSLVAYVRQRDLRLQRFEEERQALEAEKNLARAKELQEREQEKQKARELERASRAERYERLRAKAEDGTLTAFEMLDLERLTIKTSDETDRIADEFAKTRKGTGTEKIGKAEKDQVQTFPIDPTLAKQGLARDNAGKLYCKVCNQRFQLEGEFKSHLSSKKHRNAQQVEQDIQKDRTEKPTTTSGDSSEAKQKKRRRATEKMEASKEPNNEDVPAATHVCKICKMKFESRSKLFKHIETTGHAAPKAMK
ncbi:Chaperone protein DnaJ subfamily C [Giardia muris]|uniref:Chaperone protein DnaJ subfamily C n=1 Tax=Giardia muris TaxID=5742 RepID=A0A4Z1T7M4_GIAMU|nr:Chaperone protein DnaJ subfamily C [Giardia muris]|eukprot:TNJ30083.1 Chaperone protein DnaJ subfamily C [Giardia muris]